MRRAPARGLFALEPMRAAQELFVRVLSDPMLRRAPKGDGHHVLVMPGLGGSDLSTRVMRAFLRRLGYYVHAWRLGRNNLAAIGTKNGGKSRTERHATNRNHPM